MTKFSSLKKKEVKDTTNYEYNKKKWTYRYREQTNGYQWGEGSEEGL